MGVPISLQQDEAPAAILLPLDYYGQGEWLGRLPRDFLAQERTFLLNNQERMKYA